MRTRSKLSILLSVLLCCTMLAGLLPTVAFAEDSTTVSSENGADTSSKNSADTSSKNGADTTSKNGADTTSENGADTTSENGADTSPEKGTAAPAAAPAAAPSAAPSVAWIGETGYPTLEEAVNAAASGDTIVLGEGKFTLYKKGADTKGKNLTFVGQGADKTAWGIGATLPDPANFGKEYNGDYSFDGSGTITFRNMTLQSGSADYLGFIRADKTVVENCIINGKTFYWGYTSATFRNTTFFCPNGDYAVWTYSSPEMTFDGCTFNSSGKTINVYTDYGAGKCDITVNFNNCTVNSEVPIKNVLNINDSNMGNYKYRIHISGNNSINGSVYRDKVTCSRWFGFGGKPGNNTGRSVVTFDSTPVFENGEMLGHELHPEYTDGYKDNAYTVTATEWVKAEGGTHYTRSVKKVCDYCGYDAETKETGYSVTYTDGVDSAEIFEDQSTVVPENAGTPAFNGTPAREGYVFSGWAPVIADRVTQNATYAATWKTDANGNGKADEDEEKYTVTYTDGVDGEEVFADQAYGNLLSGTDTPAFRGTPTREGYRFGGWDPEVSKAVTKNVTYTAKWEKLYTVTYTDGAKGKAFKDQVYDNLLSGTATPAFDGKPTRRGYTFSDWAPKVSKTVTKDVTYVAQWKSNSGKDNVPKTGSGEIAMILGSVLMFSFCGAAAVFVYDRKRRQG